MSNALWTREQLLVAFTLYTRIPFGRLHARNPEIIKYAELIGRTPSALSMKLVNIASLDPVITDSGRSGLKGSSKADKAMWLEMNSNWEYFWAESELATANIISSNASSKDISENDVSYSSENKIITSTSRYGQSSFRKAVLSAHNDQCCITGINIPKLLIASHIVPWSKDKANRLNPRNGLCLSSLHDKAFDSGLLTISEKYEVVLSSDLKKGKSPYHKSSFIEFEGKKIILPEKFSPNQDFLEYHRINVFSY